MKGLFNIKQLNKAGIVKNSAKLLSANFLAQIIGFAVYPILTRLYSPDDFGLLNLFLSIGGVLILFATGEYHCSIVLPESREQGRACFQVGMLFNLAITLLCFLSIPFAPLIAQSFNTPQLASWYFLLPFYVFAMAFWQLLNYWYVRQKSFATISTYQVTQSLFGAAQKILYGWKGFLNGGLLVSVVLAPWLALIAMIAATYGSVKDLLCVSWTQCKQVASRYRKFPLFSLPKALINYVSNNLPILLLVPFFGLEEVGYFGMAIALAHTPINQVCKSFYQVLYQHITEKVNGKASIWPFFKKLILGVAGCVLLVFGALYFVLPWLTTWLLGPEWTVSGTYIQIMLPWLAVICIYSTIDFIIDIFGKQDKQFYFECALLVLRVAGLMWGIYLQNFMWAVLCFSMASAVLRIIYIVYQCKWIKAYENTLNAT